ncbi:MAG: helix-turn-helix transcriptional regulator [Ruminococcaceae bacterium]|nr:helix-turn-helix transcriptional regulator [Oscillospiraceae bacterium]
MNKDIYIHQIGMDSYYKIWHTSGKSMIMYMHTSGGSIVSTQQNYPIQKGGLCFIGGNHFHYTMPDDPANYDRSKIFLHNEDLEALLTLFPSELQMQDFFNPNALIYTRLPERDQQFAENILDNIRQYDGNPRYLPPVLKSGFMSLLVFLRKNQTHISSASSNVIQKAVEFINAHVTEDIDLDSICRDIHISKYHFCRQFKTVTGFTVMEYLLKTRIVTARRLLTETALPISEISNRCGFSSLSYFCRVFKAQTQSTPLQFRKAARLSPGTGNDAGEN